MRDLINEILELIRRTSSNLLKDVGDRSQELSCCRHDRHRQAAQTLLA